MAAEPGSAAHAEQVAAYWDGQVDQSVRSFWQSPVVMAQVNRRITGQEHVTPEEYLLERHLAGGDARVLSLGCGGAEYERRLLEIGAARHVLGVDIAAERLERAREATPPELRDRLELLAADLETWRPQGTFDLIMAHDVLHHLQDIEGWLATFRDILTPGGLIYVHEFVGPSRFQWTDAQIAAVNALLDALDPRLRADVVLGDGTPREPLRRPDVGAFIASDPSEAIRSDELPDLLAGHLEPVEVHAYGGAVFHQFFNRIMGNFAGHDDLVRTVMEIDFVLTDRGVLRSDYLWGVYRVPDADAPARPRATPQAPAPPAPRRAAPAPPDTSAPGACPVCGAAGRVAHRDRERALCAQCGAFERHRALVRTFDDLLRDGSGRTLLEAGPVNAYVLGGAMRDRGWTVTTVDLTRTGNPNDPRDVSFVDLEADLTDLHAIPDDSIDVVIVQHVIEEIEDHRRALAEIARVLTPTGTALLEIPWSPDRPRSEHHPPDHFGNVWRFGADLRGDVEACFEDVTVTPLAEEAYRGDVFVARRPR